MKKFGITIIGDSIIYNRYKGKIFNCAKYLKKDLLKKKNFNFLIKKKTIHGGSSEDILNLLPNYLLKLKLKYKNIIIVQIGINDSWHYKSLDGKPNVAKKKFLYNLGLIDRLRKKYKFKNILFLSYHSIKKRRIEINGKSINQNLMS